MCIPCNSLLTVEHNTDQLYRTDFDIICQNFYTASSVKYKPYLS